MRGSLLAEAVSACVDDDNGPCDQGGFSIVVLPLLLVGGAMGGAAEGGGVWYGIVDINPLKLLCPSHTGLTSKLGSVPPPPAPPTGMWGITNVGNVVHSGELSFDDRPCLVDFFVPFSLANPFDVTPVPPGPAIVDVEGGGNEGADFFFLGGFLPAVPLLLGLIFLSASSC